MAVAQQVVASGFGAFPPPACGSTVHYHTELHTHLGPNCNLAEAPDCQQAPAPYRAPPAPPVATPTAQALQAHVNALAVGVAVCALGAALLLGLSLARWL
jgi:hypothetical protein